MIARSAALLLLCARVLIDASLAQAAEPPRPAERNRPGLGRLEQESVEDAAATLGVSLDPAPAGKRIGRILVVNHEVFSRRDWHFQLLNFFHRTTRTKSVARELLFRTGDVYNAALVEESIRNLQSPPPMVVGNRTLYVPEWASVIAIVPVRAAKPGEVDLLVVTRDVWSLRFNTVFEYQQDTLSYLATSLSENNLFGWRKYLAANFVMDQGAFGIGPTYFDPNVVGTRLVLYANATAWYQRADRHYEGSSATFSIRYPLYALSRRWGGGVDVIHNDVVVRRFRGKQLWQEAITRTDAGMDDNMAMAMGSLGVDPMEAPAIDSSAEPMSISPAPVGTAAANMAAMRYTVPHIYRRRTVSFDAHVVRSFMGPNVVQRLTGGFLIDARSVAAVEIPGVPIDPLTSRAFLEQVAPKPETRSEPYLKYDLFTPDYGVFRDLDTFDLRENRRLGPSLSVRVGYGVPAFRSDFAGPSVRTTAAVAARWGDGFGQVAATVAGRWRSGALVDQYLDCEVLSASPVLAGTFRVIVHGHLSAVRADTYRTLFLIGGQTGLRGHIIGDFKGPVAAIGHVELRTLPLHVLSQRIGALLFYDVGHAAHSLHALSARHDFGLGLRWLIPQLNSAVLRVDWAFATRTTIDYTASRPGFVTTQAGWPGRVTAGYEQVF